MLPAYYCVYCGSRYEEGVTICPMDGRPAHRIHRETEVLGRHVSKDYVLLEPVSLGVESNVYLAVHLPTEREVAIKILRIDAPDVRARFEREGRILSRLTNPHVVRVVGAGITRRNEAFLATEWIDGQTLASLIAAGEAPMLPERAVRIVLQVCEALAEAHEARIVHRDIKPENIIIVQSGSGEESVRLVDFGIAKDTKPGASRLTPARMTAGTPAYMSPEQCDDRDVDGRSDLYSLGVVLFEMLTGQLPHDDPSWIRLVHRKTTVSAPRLGEVLPPLAILIGLEDLVAELLSIDPTGRPSSATELFRRLKKEEKEMARGSGRLVPVETGNGEVMGGTRHRKTPPDPGTRGPAMALALSNAVLDALRPENEIHADPLASRLASRLASLERSLSLAFRNRLTALHSGDPVPDLDRLIGGDDPSFLELLHSFSKGAAWRRDEARIRSAMAWVINAHDRIASFWMERAAKVGDEQEQAFCREAAAATRRHRAALERLAARLGVGLEECIASGALPESGDALFDALPALAGAPGPSIRITSELLTGIPMIDGQHRVLFEMASRVLDRGFLAPNHQVIQRVLPYLQAYVNFHFAAEEFAMTFFGYPGITAHKAAHGHFREKLGEVVETARIEGTSRSVREVLELRIVRLLYHVRTVDRVLASFLAEGNREISAEMMDRAGIREPRPLEEPDSSG